MVACSPISLRAVHVLHRWAFQSRLCGNLLFGLVDGWTPMACLMRWLVLGSVDLELKAVFFSLPDRLEGDRYTLLLFQ